MKTLEVRNDALLLKLELSEHMQPTISSIRLALTLHALCLDIVSRRTHKAMPVLPSVTEAVKPVRRFCGQLWPGHRCTGHHTANAAPRCKLPFIWSSEYACSETKQGRVVQALAALVFPFALAAALVSACETLESRGGCLQP